MSVWFHISILFKVIFCEIDTLLTTSGSDAEVSNCFSPIAFKSLIVDFLIVKLSEVILHKWAHCNVVNQSINVGRESFTKRQAIFMVIGTRLGKNVILIQTIFKLNYYTDKFGTTIFLAIKGWIVHLVK